MAFQPRIQLHPPALPDIQPQHGLYAQQWKAEEPEQRGREGLARPLIAHARREANILH
eukprot:CAMPEP_0182542346 /NCGR_PEP_ID=MMETSP1323-20130603/30013_1 /TAXON_ID=236787 /ORGANISM="Florenciella parvula, Strain RCC1693" /LENGTH=57 /DNA_ID=CAMNT_0024753189 /DNA_START=225 /DNA_END=398 /DNA_ORIENTATION=-